jgi:hypothetical protein
MKSSVAVGPTENCQKLPLQGMTITHYPYFGRKTLEVGSVSWLPLIRSIMI